MGCSCRTVCGVKHPAISRRCIKKAKKFHEERCSRAPRGVPPQCLMRRSGGCLQDSSRFASGQNDHTVCPARKKPRGML